MIDFRELPVFRRRQAALAPVSAPEPRRQEQELLRLAVAERLEDGFRYLPRRIDNVRSQRALEEIGAVRSGSRPDAGGRDSYLYRITAAAFAGHDD